MVRRASGKATLAGLALALAATAWAQSAPSNTAPSSEPPANSPQSRGVPSDAPAGQPAPGTTPMGGDIHAPDNPSATKSTASDKAPSGISAASDEAPAVSVDADKVIVPGSRWTGVKTGSIDDVNAVGDRDIGGRGMSNWYSNETEIKMGRMYAMEIEKSTRFITDPVVTEYVNRIGQNIVRNSDCKVPFTIKVIDSDEINAFALPGGFFFVNSGLILNADEEAELAAVMAHETAHVCAHHAVRQMTRMSYAQFGAVPLILIGGWTGYGVYEAAALSVPVAFMKFSREFEAQADYLGVQYMYRAGYDPQAFISFFEKIQALEKRKPGAVAKAFSDHPQTPDRILRTQEEIAHILPPRDEYTVNTSEFDDVKARLGRLESKRRLIDARIGNKPSLHKTGEKPGDPASGDDRPTMHRSDEQN
ncbi:MAG: M48 family metalloprotease [Terracidiphilus sp.]